MGIENFAEKIEKAPFQKEFSELTEKEREIKEKMKAILQENVELNGRLISDDLDITEHQRRYPASKLKELGREVREVFGELREATGYEVSKDMQGIKAADKYYEEIKKTA